MPPPPRRRLARVGGWTIGIVAGLLLLIAAVALLLDSGAGRRFITDQIDAVAPESGLRIKVGRIEGSIYRDATLRNVRLYDTRGQFLVIPEARLAWHPFDYLWRRQLTIDALVVPRADLARLPVLRQSREPKPLLPGFDILVRRLSIDRLNLAAGVAGPARTATVDGRATIRTGTADVALNARLIGGGDRVRLALLASPDRGDFDIDADVVAPRGGALMALAGIDRDISGIVRGQGNWRGWRGALLADSAGAPLARLRLTANRGRYTAAGRLRPDLLSTGLVQRLTAGGVSVDAAGTFANRRWDGTASLVADGLKIDSAGQVDLGRGRFTAMRIDGWLRRPAALLDRLDGQNVQLGLLLDGAFAAPRFEYRLTAPWLAFGTTRFSGIEARGSGMGGRAAAQIPLALRVARVTGVGAFAEGIVRNLRADGVLQYRDNVLTSDLIRVASDGLDGRFTVLANFVTGNYAIGFDGALPGLEINGLGRVDLVTNLAVRQAAGGTLGIGGTARAVVRRLDNGFLRTLGGGLPVVTTSLAIGSDGIVRFSNLRVTAPLLTLTGQGLRRTDGTFQLSARGQHRTYGPVVLTLDGPIDRPRVSVQLARPLASAQLTDVDLQLLPTASGFDFAARGGSLLGPFAATGRILLPTGGAAVIDLDRLTAGGTAARGRLTVVTGGLAGTLTVAGGGLDGTIALTAPRGIQRIALALAARNAQFAGPPPISIGRGRIDAVVLLDPAGTTVQGNFEAAGLRRGSLSIARITGDARLTGGVGRVRASLAGARGRGFNLQLAVDVGPDSYRIQGQGTLARQPIRLTTPAVLRRENGGWRLEPAELVYAGGRIRLAGTQAAGALTMDAAVADLPMTLLDLAYPNLGLGGRASGRLSYRDGAGAPTGSLQLRLRGLTRAGLTDNSPAIDVGLNAALSPGNAAVRAVVESGGRVIGRVQGRAGPLAGGGGLVERITRAPLVAQVRYNGEAGTLWRLTGIENLALSGPVAVAADAGGTLADPRIRGVLRTTGARFESFQTGTEVSNVAAVGRFDGSRLQLRNITGTTRGGGTVTGEGDFDLAAASGFAMDVRLQATRALLIERDDLVARVSGPARLVSTGAGGTISGTMTLDEGSFRLGRATAAEALPVITVVERNVPDDRPQPRSGAAPWRLDLAVRGRNRFTVTGLGLESEWSTDIAVRGDVSNFAMTGTANLVRGEYNFAGRRFELESGRIRFTGSTPIDPVLDIAAVSDITGIDARIRVRGTGLRPEITFESTPALPEDELLSRILFGSSITDISVTEAAQLGVALASLRSGGDGIDPINAIRRATGLDRLRILPANSELGSGTSVAAGKYLTRRVYVEIITDGQGYSATRAEYQITRWLALLTSISTLGQEQANVRIKRDY